MDDGAVLDVMVKRPSVATLRSPLKDDLNLDEDLFSWPHPMSSGEALFVLDDAAERATRDIASRSRERVWVALAEMSIVAATISRLGTEARRQMIDDVEAQA